MAKTMKMKHRYFKIGERVFNCDYKHSDNFDFGVISNINGKPESQVINAARSRTKVRRCHCPFFTERNKMKTKLFAFLTKTKKGADTESFFDDDEIFFYAQNFDELITLCGPNNGEDFIIVDYNDLFEEL